MRNDNHSSSNTNKDKSVRKGLRNVFAGAIAERCACLEVKKKYKLLEHEIYILVGMGDSSRAARACVSGYEIAKQTRQTTQRVYNGLKALMAAGFVELVAEREGIRGKQYGLTGLGWLVLRHWERVYREREKYLLNNARKMRQRWKTFEYEGE